MNEDKKGNIWQEVQQDYKMSWRLLKQNYKAFFMTEIFAISTTIILILILVAFVSYFKIHESLLAQSIIGISFVVFLFIYNIFISCQFGLAYDIYSSGDMFAEFKGSFKYFRKFWWQYLFIGILKGLFDIPASISINTIINFFIMIYILMIFPGITDENSIISSFKISFVIYKNDYKRLIMSLGIFYLLFELPQTVIQLVIISMENNSFTLNSVIFTRIIGLYNIGINLVVYPILTLIITRIYNTSVLEIDNSTEILGE